MKLKPILEKTNVRCDNSSSIQNDTSKNLEKDINVEESSVCLEFLEGRKRSHSSASLLPTDKICSGIDINSMSYAQRIEYAYHPLTKKLLLCAEKKQTNLVHNPDVTDKQQFLELADAVGPYICALKTHIDIIANFDWDLIEKLVLIAQKHNFLIIEDRKFCDIGSVVQQQYKDGIYKIVEWADIVIAHAISGPGVIEGLKQVGKPCNRGMLLLAQMSSAENLIDAAYTQRAVLLAEQHVDFVVGLVAQERCVYDPGFLIFTPGINMKMTNDSLAQRYSSPEHMVGQRGTDIMIVGRGIYEAKNPSDMAKQYRESGWQAYLARLHR